jgi:tetratricopeptide (TPR) repeat protein
VALAWQLRQRDYNRALRLATDALIFLDKSPLSETESARCKARIRLIRAEVNILCAELEEGECEIKLAQSKFESRQDYVGQGDCQWLLATIWQDRGMSQQENVHLNNALELYQAAGDQQRVDATNARRMARDAFTDAAATSVRLTELFPDPIHLHDSILTWILTARATVAALTDDPGAAIKLDLQAYHASLNSGQIRHALVCAANVAEDFATLSDLDSALEWAENALSLARNTNWPYSNGFCLMQVGDVLRRLERYDESEVFLLDAIHRMGSMPSSRGHINALNHLGLLALDLGKFELA